MGVGERGRLAGDIVGECDRVVSQSLGEGGEALFGVAGEGAAGGSCLVAQSEELIERGLCSGWVAEPVVDRLGAGLMAVAGDPRDRIDHAVEDERPHPAGEQVGVGDAEVGAVGVAGVGELSVADGGASRSRSRATSAVAMWSTMAPPRDWQARFSSRSARSKAAPPRR